MQLASSREQSVSDLVDHIVHRYHAPLLAQLPRLLEMSRKTESRHAGECRCPSGLTDLLERTFFELELHIEKEEQVLFPLICFGAPVRPVGPITLMMQEHADHESRFELIRRLTDDFEVPPEACTTWRALYLGLEAIERDLMACMQLENHVLFPKALGL